MKQTTPQNRTSLKDLTRRIVDGSTTASMLFKSSRDDALKAATEAVLMGIALCEAKDILGAHFKGWLQEEFPEMDKGRARRYMLLAKNAGELDMEQPAGFKKILAVLEMDDLGPTVVNLLAMN